MPNGVPFNTGFRDENGADLGNQFVEKDYLIDAYPNLVPQQKASTLWGWGDNSRGGLGNFSTISQSSPVQTVAGGTNWKQVTVGDFNPAFTAGAGIKTDGTLWTWGYNKSGILGNNSSYASRSSPVQTIAGGTNWKSIDMGSIAMGIKTDGTLWVWGCNQLGYLGINSSANYKVSPVQTISGGNNWKSASAGSFSAGAIKTDGTLWVWGIGGSGILGNNATTNQSSPVQTVAGGTNWKQLSIGGSGIMAAVKTDGTLWTWGEGRCGALGTNAVVNQSSPVQTVSGGTNWKQVSAGCCNMAAVKRDGTLWIWGSCMSSFGAVNACTSSYSSSPVQTISGGTNWKCVKLSKIQFQKRVAVALKTDGTLWSWGYGITGTNGTKNSKLLGSPTQTIAGGSNWKDVCVDGETTLAIKEEGDW